MEPCNPFFSSANDWEFMMEYPGMKDRKYATSIEITTILKKSNPT
jgi:hypothetical protein